MENLLYGELSPWYRLLDPPEDHAEEAEIFRMAFIESIDGPAKTLLELGAGAGHDALTLRAAFDCTLSDLSESMLALSQELNPTCRHELGDMRTLRLGRVFDAVLVHDAICVSCTAAMLKGSLRGRAGCNGWAMRVFSPRDSKGRSAMANATKYSCAEGPSTSNLGAAKEH